MMSKKAMGVGESKKYRIVRMHLKLRDQQLYIYIYIIIYKPHGNQTKNL